MPALLKAPPVRGAPTAFPRFLGQALAVMVAGASLGHAAEFHPLGFLGGTSQSVAYGVSADGLTVVGESIAPEGMEAFRWTVPEGMVGLGFFPNQPFRSSQAHGVSADGAIIVGTSTRPDSLLEDGAPFRWTAQTGLVLIPNLGGSDTGGIAEDITLDGSVIVGWCASPTGYQAFRWTQPTGTQGLGQLPNEQISRAMGVSADGSIIVGNVSQGSLTNPHPFRWTAETGKVILPQLNPNTVGSANAITPDGAVIVGQSAGRAVRWVGGQVLSLGELAGGLPTSTYWALAVTPDGSQIYGVGNYNPSQGTGEAFIWDAPHGMRSLRQVLITEFGLNLAGWGLFAGTGVSADGFVIAGYGFDPQGFQEAWLVRLRYPVGDMNCDGLVGFGDINPFVLALSDPTAYQQAFPNCAITNGDIDGDGTVDFADINPFVGLLAG